MEITIKIDEEAMSLASIDFQDLRRTLKVAARAEDLVSAMRDIQQELRSRRKYGEHPVEVQEAYDWCWDLFWKVVHDRDLVSTLEED